MNTFAVCFNTICEMDFLPNETCSDNLAVEPSFRFVYRTVNDNAKVYQQIIQYYTSPKERCKYTKSWLYITFSLLIFLFL